jgi:hypothetical protein
MAKIIGSDVLRWTLQYFLVDYIVLLKWSVEKLRTFRNNVIVEMDTF